MELFHKLSLSILVPTSLSPCAFNPLQSCAGEKRIEDWYLLNQILTRLPPFDPLPNSLRPLSFGHLALHQPFLVHLWQMCVRACVFSAESGWKREGSSQTMACLLPAFRLPCTCFPFCTQVVRFVIYCYVRLPQASIVAGKELLCVWERGLLLELGPFFLKISLDWSLCLLHNWLCIHSVCKYFNSNSSGKHAYTFYALHQIRILMYEVRWLYSSSPCTSGPILPRACHLKTEYEKSDKDRLL